MTAMTQAPTHTDRPAPASASTAPPLNPVQQATVTDILGLGSPRPTPRPNLIADLRAHIENGTREALAGYSGKSLFLSKAQLANVVRCEGLYKAGKEAPRTKGVLPAVAQGTVVHRAIQHCHTHARVPVEDNVRAAIETTQQQDPEFATFWRDLDTGAQSDFHVNVTNTVMTFLDSWPMLPSSWSPRFEHGMQARIGALTLSGRTDLIIGRPRTDGQQSMVIVDWKSGSLYPEHEAEADFYALLATLRFGVPPFRSLIYSLASATTTNLDVDETRLFRAADAVIGATNAIVEVMDARRELRLAASTACSWCPARDTCPENTGTEAVRTPDAE